MTVRAVSLGLLLGLLISALSYFNDTVIRQSFFISNHLPVSVFGVLVFALLMLNPALRMLGARWPLGPTELAMMTALGLAACGWPGHSYFFGLIPNVAMPNHWNRTSTAWQSTGAMSYVPGGSAALAEGHVRDWRALVMYLAAPAASESHESLRAIWDHFGPSQKSVLIDAERGGRIRQSDRATVLLRLNRALADPNLFPLSALLQMDLPRAAEQARDQMQAGQSLTSAQVMRLNRMALVSMMPDAVWPPPRGDGVLLAGGEAEPAVHQVVFGSAKSEGVSLAGIPWEVWWPTLRLWGGLGLLLAGAALCLSLIVHPQWSQRELLPYPLARFVREICEREPASPWPKIAASRLFWIGVLAMIVLHTINGLGTWFPDVPKISLSFNFYALHQLFPNAKRIEGQWYVFSPRIYLAVAAFAVFLPSKTSFSVGISYFAYLAFAAILLQRGIPTGNSVLGGDAGNMMRFGAYVAAGVVIFYAGRRYYTHVMGGMLCLGRHADTPIYAIIAGYGLCLTAALSVVMLYSAGLDSVLSVLFVLMTLLTFVVLSRIVCETGMFFVQTWWMPVGVLTALLGIEAIGPTGYIVLALASIVLIGDPRTLLMPYLSTALQLRGRNRGLSPEQLAPWLVVMLLAGFAVAGMATFAVVHSYGAGGVSKWAFQTLPMMPFDNLAGHLADMSAHDTLGDAMKAPAGLAWSAITLDGVAVSWALLGMGLWLATAFARLRLAWWPIHPVLFLIWGTMPSAQFAVSFLLGWLIKTAAVKSFGVKGHSSMMPLMVGVIAGELLAALLWIIVGGTYYGVTGQVPATYRIFP